MDFYEVCNWGILQKFGDTFQFWMQVDSRAHFIWRAERVSAYILHITHEIFIRTKVMDKSESHFIRPVQFYCKS